MITNICIGHYKYEGGVISKVEIYTTGGVSIQHHKQNTFSIINSRSNDSMCQHSKTESHPIIYCQETVPNTILNAVLDEETGGLMEMRHLMKNPKYREVWGT